MKMGRGVYSGYKAEEFLRNYIPVSESQLVDRIEKVKIKAPLVLKIISKDALHKSDIGGVKIVKNQEDISDAFHELISIAHKKNLHLEGIMVQKYYEGEQLIIGINKDPVFGHAILFGLGGVFTEVLQDTSTRKCPIKKIDAEEMIEDLKASKIFHGFRGKKLNTKVLVETLVKVSQIPLKHKNIKELDINPFILDDKRGVAVDARMAFD